MAHNFRRGVQIIPYRRRGGRIEFLVMHRIRNWTGWEFPKGGIEPRESPRVAALREMGEECSCRRSDIISIRPTKYRLVINYSEEFRKRSRYDGAMFMTLIAELAGDAKISIGNNTELEHDAFKWLSEAKAAKLLHPNVKEVLDAAARSIRPKPSG